MRSRKGHIVNRFALALFCLSLFVVGDVVRAMLSRRDRARLVLIPLVLALFCLLLFLLKVGCIAAKQLPKLKGVLLFLLKVGRILALQLPTLKGRRCKYAMLISVLALAVSCLVDSPNIVGLSTLRDAVMDIRDELRRGPRSGYQAGTLAICMMYKDTPQQRLVEWVRFHQLLNATVLSMFDNTQYPTKEVYRFPASLQPDVQSKRVLYARAKEHRPFRQLLDMVPQCIRTVERLNMTYVIIIDTDEFVYPTRTRSTLPEAIDDLFRTTAAEPPRFCATLPRLAFGAGTYSRQTTAMPASVVESFVMRAPYPLTNEKWWDLLSRKYPPISPENFTFGHQSGIYGHADFSTLGKVLLRLRPFLEYQRENSAEDEVLAIGQHGLCKKAQFANWSRYVNAKSPWCLPPKKVIRHLKINHYLRSWAEFTVKSKHTAFGRKFSLAYPNQFDTRDLNIERDVAIHRWLGHLLKLLDPPLLLAEPELSTDVREAGPVENATGQNRTELEPPSPHSTPAPGRITNRTASSTGATGHNIGNVHNHS